MEQHQQSVMQHIEQTSRQALVELKGKADEVEHLRSKVDTELDTVCSCHEQRRWLCQ